MNNSNNSREEMSEKAYRALHSPLDHPVKKKYHPHLFEDSEEGLVDSENDEDDLKSIGRKFCNLKEKWMNETAHMSSIKDRCQNSTYQKIIEMDLKVVPFLIKDMEKNNTHWFWALHSITGANPVKKENQGRVEDMVKDWKNWWENTLNEVTDN